MSSQPVSYGQLQPSPDFPTWQAVDAYTTSHLHASKTSTPAPALLAAALKGSAEAGLPDIAVSPPQGKFLLLQARLGRAKHILEVGTLGGYSTLWLAHSGPDVRVTSVEVSARHAEVARANVARAGPEVAARVDVVVGNAVNVLRGFEAEVREGRRERFDFTFIDADKEHNWEYFDSAVKMSPSGAGIVIDNMVRRGRVADANCEDPRVQGCRRAAEKVGQDERVDGCVIQTVGEKGYDGFLMAIVR